MYLAEKPKTKRKEKKAYGEITVTTRESEKNPVRS